MPKLLPRQYAKILYELTHQAKDRGAAVAAFMKFLKRKRVTKKLPEIIAEFEKVAAEAEGIMNVHVTTARPMPENKIKEIAAKALGKEVAVEMEVDESIVGGLIMQTKTHRYDGSVKNQLHQLSNQLASKK